VSEAVADLPRRDVIAEWLEAAPCRIGQILIERDAAGGFALRHRDDAERDDLFAHSGLEAAAKLARFDDGRDYRPLKTAPNLRHGWLLRVATADEVIAALNLFYPGRLPAYLASRNGSLRTTTFRETLGRQSGMYRVAARISDRQADKLIGSFCRSDGGCLRTILWQRDAFGTVASSLLPLSKFDPAQDQAGRGERVLPLLCQEACNLLVSEARKVVKAA
jgi:sirohydrochlorin cobaltochelatase